MVTFPVQRVPPHRNIAVACDSNAAAIGCVHHGAAEGDGSGVIKNYIRSLVVAAGGYTVAPVVRIAQFIGVAFRRAGITGPFRDHAGGISGDA